MSDQNEIRFEAFPAQPGDYNPDEFRNAMHRVADMVADYLDQVGEYPVVPKVKPGDVRSTLPAQAPENGESLDSILDDYKSLIEPNITHWNHPNFMAYFAVTGSRPGVLGETLTAAMNINAMLWRTSPAATELEELVCDWLRQAMDLPETFKGHINDTASVSSFVALAAARNRVPGANIREYGMAGRPDLPPLMLYCSDQAHSSIEKDAIALGLGQKNVRKIASDDQYQMRVDLLEEAIAEDKRAGRMPMAIVATIGTTSTTSIDPVPEIADICERENIWLHIDGAYAGSAAIIPEFRERFTGLERADSFVLNPHKWLFVPVDCSVLYIRDPENLKDTFSLVPEYLRTSEEGVTNLMDNGIQLGRRFRSLKLWMVIRAFGLEGLRANIRSHCAMAQAMEARMKADRRFELLAPTAFSTLCFRAVPPMPAEELDMFNEKLLENINRKGPVFLSHTKLKGRYTIRMCIGNLKTTPDDLETVWQIVSGETTALWPEVTG